MPETFFGSSASKVWSAGTSDSDFELCILLKEEEKFYHVLLVEIRHLIRLTAISREIKSCLLDNDNLRDIRKVYVTLSKVIRKKYQVVIAAGSHLFPFRTEKLSPFAPMVLQYNAGE